MYICIYNTPKSKLDKTKSFQPTNLCLFIDISYMSCRPFKTKGKI